MIEPRPSGSTLMAIERTSATRSPCSRSFFFFNATPTTEIYTLSLHDALPICRAGNPGTRRSRSGSGSGTAPCGHRRRRSEEHTSELQSPCNLVCRLLLEKKKKIKDTDKNTKQNKYPQSEKI